MNHTALEKQQKKRKGACRMAGRKKDPAATEATRQRILETAFELFSQKNIESVSMGEVARECGVAAMTVYRYFSTKPGLVVAVATWKWARLIESNQKYRPHPDFEGMTAAEVFDFYLDSFLRLYRNNRDMLRFNQFFNIYVQSETIDEATIRPYGELIRAFAERFHIIYERALLDRTVRTDVPEEKMFRTTLHLMLAAMTRYAVGLVYKPENEDDAIEELKTLRRALLREYTVNSEFGIRNSESGTEILDETA